MEFYISPETRPNVERKLRAMFKHLDEQPTISFGPVEKIVKETIYDYGYEGHERNRTKVSAIKVEIENIVTSYWVLVATVDYKHNRMLMCDRRYFKDIPEQYGLKYTKCDHCGSEHSRRIESHILYNEDTDEWMQVGSTCINKMVNGGKYINGLMMKLYEVIKFFGGCTDDEWYHGSWRPSQAYLYEGIQIDAALSYCLDYMNEHGDTWQKSSWDGYVKTSGTNDFLIDKMKNGTAPFIDETLFNNIKNYFESMERGEDDEYNGPSLTQKIIDAFVNNFITLKEMYIPWFAITMYNNTFKKADFETLIKKHGITKGMELNICGTLEAMNQIEAYDWRGEECYVYEAIIKDEKTGIKFMKEISYPAVIEKYKGEDNKYRFSGKVKYIAYKRQYVGLGGRLKKSK
jgi:hypothetical protein